MHSRAILAFIGILAPAVAHALPDGLPPGVPLRIVFVTSTTSNGNIGGLAGADAFVAAAAMDPLSLIADRSVTAVLSVVGTGAQERFVDAGEPIYNTRGELVAASLADMFAGGATALANPVLYDEAGEENAGIVWTGTDADGTLSPTHCTSYSTDTDQQDGRIGRSDEIDGQWTEWGTLNCVNPARLYGLTEVLVVPEPAGPLQPLVCLAALLLRASAFRRSARARTRSRAFASRAR